MDSFTRLNTQGPFIGVFITFLSFLLNSCPWDLCKTVVDILEVPLKLTLYHFKHVNWRRLRKNNSLQECIPVGCVPPAVIAVFPAKYAPCHAHIPATHAPCHAFPLPHMPPMHTPLHHHTCPLPCMPPPCHISPHHACPLPHMTPDMHAPLMNRMTDRCKNITLPQLRCPR